jgi:hypothetical protein
VNSREKRLLIGVGAVLALFVVVFGARAMFLKPLRDIDKKTAALREKLEKLKAERRAYFAAEEVVKHFTQHTFAEQIDQASAKSGEMLTKQILLSGLREADFSRLPVGPRRLRGGSEIGWSIQGQGKLSDIVNLLFLLQESPYVHRIENLAVSAGDAPGQVRAGFRFMTLVVDSAPVVDPIPLPVKFTVESPERRVFDRIAARDLLRPYVKRAPGSAEPGSGRPTELSGPASLRVVSLSDWSGQPEVHVRDLNNQKTIRYRLGDELADGIVAMVDYRPLPKPGNEGLQSFSRVILKIGAEFWAIERGQTLAEKRRLAKEELPPSLSKVDL